MNNMVQFRIEKIVALCLCLLPCHFVLGQTKAIDLGLSVKWADCNVGAEHPWDAGMYFLWGDPSGQKDAAEVFVDVDTIGDIVDSPKDIAKVNMGGNWRMPTSDELKELKENCIWEVECRNNVLGFKVTGKNGASIFVPAIGGYDRGVFRTDQGAGLWSGCLNQKWKKIDFMLLWVRESNIAKDGLYTGRVEVRQATMRYKFNVRAICNNDKNDI